MKEFNPEELRIETAAAPELVRRVMSPSAYPAYIGLDVHKRIIAYCIKCADGAVVEEGKLRSDRRTLRTWAGFKATSSCTRLLC